MYNPVIELKTFSHLGTQKHGDHQGTLLGTLLIVIYIFFFCKQEFEDISSVLKLLISHMIWIAFSNQFIALICYVFVYI